MGMQESKMKLGARLYFFALMAAVVCGAGISFAEDATAPRTVPADKSQENGYADRLKQVRAAAEQRIKDDNQNTKEDKKKEAAEKKKNLQDYKEIVKTNVTQIKELFKKAEDAWKKKQYKEAGSFYQSVAMATAPGAEDMAETSRGRLIEMEDMAKEHLRAAEDADLQHDVMKEVEELAVVTREFNITKTKDVALRRLVNLKARPDVSAYVELTQAEMLETEGKLTDSISAYSAIANNPRYEHSIPALKASRKLDELQKNENTREKLRAEFLARAEKEAPVMLNSAKNYATNNMPKKAMEILQQVIDKFPETPYAVQAQKELSDLSRLK